MSLVILKTGSFHCGVISQSDSESTLGLTLVICPKPWRMHKAVRYLWDKEEHPVLCLYESQLLKLSLEGDIERKRALILSIVQRSEEHEIMSETLSPEAPSSAASLISLTAQYPSSSSPIESDRHLPIDFLKLMLLVNHVYFDSSERRSAKFSDEPMLMPLMHYFFVKEIAKHIKKLRRDYIDVTEPLMVIKGRVDPKSVIRSQQTGIPQLICRFQNFTEATPLIQALNTALEHVASGNWAASLETSEDGVFCKSKKEAAHLRRRLQSIPSTSTSQAIHILKRFRFNRLTEFIRPSVVYAISVLESCYLINDDEALERDGLLWSIDMSDIWEKLIVDGVKASGQDRVQVIHYDAWINQSSRDTKGDEWWPHRVPSPWEKSQGSGGGLRPDILLKTESRRWVLDAKYSSSEPYLKKSETQMFLYAYLTEFSDGYLPDHLALIALADTVHHQSVNQVNSGESLEERFSDKKDRAIGLLQGPDLQRNDRASLNQLFIRFPLREEVDDQECWTRYVKILGAELLRRCAQIEEQV